MKNIIADLENLKSYSSIERTFIFGSFLNNPEGSNDIDIILFSKKSNSKNTNSFELSIPINRIQFNCYKKQDKIISSKNSYDIVVINNNEILNKFIKRNSENIIEI